MLLIQVLRKLRQEGGQLEASLIYIVRSCVNKVKEKKEGGRGVMEGWRDGWRKKGWREGEGMEGWRLRGWMEGEGREGEERDKGEKGRMEEGKEGGRE